jgi:hypothetical protein
MQFAVVSSVYATLRSDAPTAKPNRLDVLGARAFGALAFRVGHFLSFVQVVKTDALDARGVEEQVFLAVRLDKPETAVSQLLNRAFGHCCVSRINCS